MRMKMFGVGSAVPYCVAILLVAWISGHQASTLFAAQDSDAADVISDDPWSNETSSAEKADAATTVERGWNFHVARLGQVDVLWKSQQITGYRIHELKKPVLYPVIGPGGHSMTRNHPLVVGKAGEPTDHPHHKSIWLAHGNVNGHNFWDEKAIIQAVGEPQLLPDEAAMIVQHEWLAAGSTDIVVREDTRLSFGCVKPDHSPLEAGWWLQYQVRVTAVAAKVTFGDTKEGFFAMRTHPNLQLTNEPGAGVTTANGRALNSEGLKDKAVWGQKAQWVAYGGTIAEQPVTIVMMDHPANLRHPTTWHARDYGLVAANPFGLHDFQKSPEGAGDFALSQGECVEFCYRIAFLPTLLDETAIRAAYREFEAVSPGWQK